MKMDSTRQEINKSILFFYSVVSRRFLVKIKYKNECQRFFNDRLRQSEISVKLYGNFNSLFKSEFNFLLSI